MLDVLYSMEHDKIPVLTKLINQRALRSIICSGNAEALYKWPTFTKPSSYKPTWENLCLILRLANMNDLVKKIKHYLKKKKGIAKNVKINVLLMSLVDLIGSNGTSSVVTAKGLKTTKAEYSGQ